jgi:hypothetical protein
MITLIYRAFTVNFRVFNVDFGRMFSGAFVVSYEIFITSRNMTVFLTFIVTCYSFFRKKTDVYFNFFLVD